MAPSTTAVRAPNFSALRWTKSPSATRRMRREAGQAGTSIMGCLLAGLGPWPGGCRCRTGDRSGDHISQPRRAGARRTKRDAAPAHRAGARRPDDRRMDDPPHEAARPGADDPGLSEAEAAARLAAD